MASVDCPRCGHTTNFNEESLDVTKISSETDEGGKKWLIYRIACERCGQEVPTGGRDGRGNV
jgi:hypothetical protein